MSATRSMTSSSNHHHHHHHQQRPGGGSVPSQARRRAGCPSPLLRRRSSSRRLLGGDSSASSSSSFLEPIPEDASKDFSLKETTTMMFKSSPRTVRSTVQFGHTSASHGGNDGCADGYGEEDEEEHILLDLDQLVLVNQDRRFHSLPPYRSSAFLDRLAARHAANMAQVQSVFHSVQSVHELMERLSNDQVAENIQRGDGIVQMHEDTMNSPCINRTNILSQCFNEFGSAVALGQDGKLYSCQLFRTNDKDYCSDKKQG